MFYFLKSDWFKLVLALAILGSIVGLLFYAQYQAKVEDAAYQKEIKLHPTAEKITIDNYELKEIDDNNQMRWRLQAKSAVLEPVTKDVVLTMINVEYFDAGAVKMKVLAPKGVANQLTHVVKLESLPKLSVVAEGQEGKSRLETKHLELTKKNQFIATGGVNINMSGVAKVSGDYATGVFGKSELQDVRIIGNTHAIIGSD
ncbi:MAG: LPS export ABC transporter periplasmic protein LptC [Cyanobacteria bacterium SZAS LIN-2]|nr:LPS export ABC transporter periplasmic protein LptC [Cyanobacteria bacterium SZAS LIN-3]MBS1997652.1 LPS export ABC transporter periplasmic protein LptC [Cyanobacteria bacterium SZAS LIN-2]MBS2009999.1 LPS export ABC transporter periplasmic protein LptC [Cyanobacteria bacterium SZAS TMP-1]